MKKAYLLIIFAAILISCKKDTKTPGAELEGNWEMTAYVAFLPSQPPLNANDVLWHFNLHNSKLTVTNNVSASYPYMIASGIYDIEIVGSTVKIQNAVCTFRFENEMLRIEINPQLDGPSMIFKRK